MSHPIVHFHPLARSGEAQENETVLDVARRAGAPIANACGGVGVCDRCNVKVVEGDASLGPPTSVELRLRDEQRLGSDERLACQCPVRGDCTVTTAYWGA